MENQVIDQQLTSNPPAGNIKYAGFWSRVGATLIDWLIMLPIIGISFYNTFKIKAYPLAIIMAFVPVLYKVLLEWKKGATVGKMALKIKVVNENYESISLKEAIMRYSIYALNFVYGLFTSYVLYSNPDFQDITSFMEMGMLQNSQGPDFISLAISLIVLISVLWVAFTATKQALHDKIAGTFVIHDYD